MLFPFLQYINPTWYFNLPSTGSYAYFPDYEQLETRHRSLIELDKNYSNWQVTKLDAAYQAWQKGFIISDPIKSLAIEQIKPTISDNYRFIRRYFHPIWTYYVLALRLITIHNPFREIGAFWQTRKISRVNLYANIYPHQVTYAAFQSPLVAAQPKVSVIIPTLNRYEYLKDALYDLESQTYKNFEVIVVDQSEPFEKNFYVPFKLDIKVIQQEEKALWLARNTAIKCSSSDLIALTEDDVRLPTDWLCQHIKCLDYFQADISSGVFFPQNRSLPKERNFFKWSDQFATGNACLYKSVFYTTGLFDRQFEKQRMGDGEFGLRAYLHGFKSVSNPFAYCIDIKAPTGGLRQMGSWDAFRPKSLLAPRPVPSVLYLYRKYFGDKLAMFALLKNVLPSVVPYQFKRNKVLLFLGSIIAIPFFPILLIQVLRSWRLSSEKLKKGPIVEKLVKNTNSIF